MKVGSLVFATEQGLGRLAKSFYDNGIVTDVMVVAHGRRTENPRWFPGAPRISDLRNAEQYADMRAFCSKMDVMLFFETPFRWDLLDWCRECRTRTFLMPMHECMPEHLPSYPDVMLCPSELDMACYRVGVSGPPWVSRRGVCSEVCVHTPVPVEVRWRPRTRAVLFVHNAGHGGLLGRNGTAEFMEAARHVKSPARLLMRSQEPIPELGGRVEVRIGTVPFEDLWNEGDVFVFPEKFNGLSLPMQEARAAGMVVAGSDRYPMNSWLPPWALIRVKRYAMSRVAPMCREFLEAIVDPKDIAAKIDELYGRDIAEYSEAGRMWASSMSWEALKPKYTEVLSL